jgi:hypothetical protein
MKRWTAAGLFVLALSPMLSAVRGDLAPRPGIRPGAKPFVPPVNPFKQPGGGRPLPVKVKLVVQVKDKIKLPVLQVPINLAMGQQGNPGGGVGEAPNPEPGRRFGLTTLVAGVALTLAFTSGGLWLVRRGARRTLAILVLTGLFAAGTAVVWADLAPRPGGPRPAKPALTPLQLPAGIELSDKLILESMPPGDHLTLIVPGSMVREKEAAPRDKRGR